MTTFTDKSDVLFKIEQLLEEYKKEGSNRNKNNKLRKILNIKIIKHNILIFLSNFLTVKNIRTAKKYTFIENIDIQLADKESDIEIMTVTFEDKILDENKIIVNKLTNNADPYFYIKTDICIYYNRITAHFSIFVNNLSKKEFIFEFLFLQNKFKSFIKKEALIGFRTIREYIGDINQKIYDIKDYFLNIDISDEEFLKCLYKYNINNEAVSNEAIDKIKNSFFVFNKKITIYNLYELIKTLGIIDLNKVMDIILNIILEKKYTIIQESSNDDF